MSTLTSALFWHVMPHKRFVVLRSLHDHRYTHGHIAGVGDEADGNLANSIGPIRPAPKKGLQVILSNAETRFHT